MNENNEVVKNETGTAEAEMEGQNNIPEVEGETPKPILPDEEYVEETAKEDPEKLEEARKRLMALVRIKGKGISSSTMKLEIEPMVYSMNISDCNNMYSAIKRHGMSGMTRQVMKYNRSQKKFK